MNMRKVNVTAFFHFPCAVIRALDLAQLLGGKYFRFFRVEGTTALVTVVLTVECLHRRGRGRREDAARESSQSSVENYVKYVTVVKADVVRSQWACVSLSFPSSNSNWCIHSRRRGRFNDTDVASDKASRAAHVAEPQGRRNEIFIWTTCTFHIFQSTHQNERLIRAKPEKTKLFCISCVLCAGQFGMEMSDSRHDRGSLIGLLCDLLIALWARNVLISSMSPFLV